MGIPSVRARSRSRVVVDVGNEVAQDRVGDELPNTLEDPWPLEQLRAQWPRRAVVRGDEVKTSPGVARNDAREQREVVLDDRRSDRERGDVDHLQARLPQEEQEEQEPLLCAWTMEPGVRVAGRHGWDDDDRLAGPVESHDAPNGLQPLLEPGEPFVSLLLAELAERARERLRHVGIFAVSRPTTLYARTGRENPGSVSSPTASATTISSVAACTRSLIRIWRGAA